MWSTLWNGIFHFKILVLPADDYGRLSNNRLSPSFALHLSDTFQLWHCSLRILFF